MPATIKELQSGDAASSHPYTIAFIANPALETATSSGTFVADPIMSSEATYDASVAYAYDNLFGALLSQAETLLADPSIGPYIRVMSIFDSGLAASDSNSLVSQFFPNIVEARRDKFRPLLANYGVVADVAFAITSSATHDRSSAWFTTDDPTRGGKVFNVDGVMMTHWFFCKEPGVVALHSSAYSMTALHEFGHAASSFSEGSIIDQYVDSPPAINVKHGRPIPSQFCTFDNVSTASDMTRNGLGYPPTWNSYHPALIDTSVPSLMDNFWMIGPGHVSEECVFDTLTRKFYHDRLMAKLSR